MTSGSLGEIESYSGEPIVSQQDDGIYTSPTSTISELMTRTVTQTPPAFVNSVNPYSYFELYCQAVEKHGFECVRNNERFAQEVEEFCKRERNLNHTIMDHCINPLLYSRMNAENMRGFHIYLAVAAPLAVIAVLFNIIALASIITMHRKMSRHIILICMSISDTIVSLSALIRRVNGTLIHIQEAEVYLLALWQTGWILSAFSLLGLAIYLFISLAKVTFNSN